MRGTQPYTRFLLPLEHLARDACRLEYNKRFFCEATVAIATKPGIGSRDPTPAPQQSLPPAEEHLFLSLNNRDIKQRGIVKFGTNPHQNDCLLGYRGTNAISSTPLSYYPRAGLQNTAQR